MAEENKIDNLFRSKLDSLEVGPPEKLRMGIEAELERQRTVIYKRRINNYRFATIALGIILILSITYFNIYQTGINPPIINETAETEKSDKRLNSSEDNSNIISDQPESVLSASAEETKAINTEGNYIIKENNSSEKNNINIIVSNNKINDINNNDYNRSKQNQILSNIISLNEIGYSSERPSITIPSEIEVQTSGINNTHAGIMPGNSIINEITPAVPEVPLSVALFYSPHYSYCVFTDNTPENDINEEKMYNDLEKSEFSYSTGLSLRYHLTERLAFSAGLTYATVIKSISLLTVYADKNSENEMYYAYPVSTGIIEIPDRNNSTGIGDSLTLSGEKILKYIQVPLLARYSINKNKFNWFINAGPSVNFLVQDKAKISAGNTEETILNKTQGLKRTSFGFVIGAGMEYKLTKNINFVAEPVFKGTFTSITENTAVKNYPYSIGANFGLTIAF